MKIASVLPVMLLGTQVLVSQLHGAASGGPHVLTQDAAEWEDVKASKAREVQLPITINPKRREICVEKSVVLANQFVPIAGCQIIQNKTAPWGSIKIDEKSRGLRPYGRSVFNVLIAWAKEKERAWVKGINDTLEELGREESCSLENATEDVVQNKMNQFLLQD